MKLLTGLSLVAALSATAANAANFHDGLTAYNANRVAEAERIYAAVLADPASTAKDRAAAARELGRIAWLIDRDLARAQAQLETALAAGDDGCATGVLLVRFLREAEQAARSVEAAARFEFLCDVPEEADQLHLQAARSGLDLAAGQSGASRAATLAAVEARLAALTETGRARLAASQVRLAAGLLKGDARQALEGWRGYFWLTAEADAPQGMPEWRGKAARAFEAGLASGASAADQSTLGVLLARAGFRDEARRLAADAGLAARAGDDANWKTLSVYLRFRDGLDKVTLDLNRRLARGGSRSGAAFEREVKRLTAEALAAVGARFSPTALTEAFGLYGTTGETSGYPSMHAGHVVQDERRPVSQYGRTGEMRFIGVDNMIANGFETWLWDGSAGTGGWAAGGVIIQVRPAYAGGPLMAWLMTSDTPARRKADERQAELDARDLEALKASPVAYLPGLSARLDRQAVLQVLARVSRPGATEAERRAAFLEEYNRAVVQHSIFIHEGRHALDQASRERLKTEDLEYRAKLSELALSDYPRLALANIDADTINTDTGHGIANTRIMKAYGEWVAAHAGEIAGYDPALPALVQLDKLTDDQIRAVARSLDPWAKA